MRDSAAMRGRSGLTTSTRTPSRTTRTGGRAPGRTCRAWPRSARTLDFMARNAVETVSPANYLATNPELLNATREQAGQNLIRGFGHWLEDIERTLEGKGPSGTEKFVLGRDVAATPGKVVMRNELVELIQYSPATPTVFAEPVLIIPAWIMKYYVLDLSAANSMVKYLVAGPHRVHGVLEKSHGRRSRARHGRLFAPRRAGAVEAVSAIVPRRKIHAVGYCIGGTLLSIAAAAFAAQGDAHLASVTLLAAQTDSASRASCRYSSVRVSSICWKPPCAAPACSRANRWGRPSPCCGRATCSGPRRQQLHPRQARRAERSHGMERRRHADALRMHAEYLRELYLNNALAKASSWPKAAA